MRRLFIVLLVVAVFLLPWFISRADELDDITKQLATLNDDLKNKESDHQKLTAQLEGIKSRVVFLEQEIAKKEKEVKLGEQTLEYQKKLLNERAKSYYKNINKNADSFLSLLIASDLSTSLQNFFYQKTVVDQDRDAIIKIVVYIKNLEDKKASLAREKAGLIPLKEEIDRQSQILAGQISTTKSKIVELSARQQEILASRLAALNIPRSAATSLSGCVDDREKDPGFSPRLAFFTYGVPNRVGLNQYGAKGRAEAGQDYEAILRAYYNFDSIQKADTNIKIRVDGHGEYSLDDYVKRIYEMPASWDIKALRAQAIAARSYALAYTNNGSGSICDSQSCQVFQDNEKGGNWNQAVSDTDGLVMMQGGSPIKAWYSSTHGGYVFSSGEIGWSGTGWTKHATDTTSGSAGNFGDLQSNAYDRSSPWFYCDWGSRSNYSSTAWLKSEEVADIANTLLLVKKDSATTEHLYQTDKSNPAGTDTWDEARVRQELQNRGTSPFTSVSSVSIGGDFGSGRTTTVTVNGNKSESFNGDEFKSRFNLRAPANIQIVGPLYNIEQR